ncbi:regulatory inactivation of DnaA Hda protein [Halopseudomonas xinjiangensis]|uniref:Regulatory inactivation of DnaA Hda protein n=1 Tax=Halopseudomonas xinjiangensis TaxID=487184 RepID=A0A1H1UL22_9GAMM|nr:DnaA regulatory inactivator Hda [Halopseudomonas xinjiangensis]SDS73020.1 regulatory inactivation of DnaA Hda protein [Halopseudomonas xinjiangensis]
MGSGQPVQLPLGIKLRDEATFSNFHAGPNAGVVAAVRALAAPGDSAGSQIYLWGPAGSGRSHLLQAACHEAAAAGSLAMYLPLEEVLAHDASIFEGMEQFDLLCLDQLEVIAGDRAWEEALFHLYNRLNEHGGKLLVAATAAPRALGIELADLASRLGWGVVFQLHSLSDEDKQQMLQLRASLRGLQLSDDVARYILSRGARGMGELFEVLERLDQASLQAQHRLTIPFVKRVMGW